MRRIHGDGTESGGLWNLGTTYLRKHTDDSGDSGPWGGGGN